MSNRKSLEKLLWDQSTLWTVRSHLLTARPGGSEFARHHCSKLKKRRQISAKLSVTRISSNGRFMQQGCKGQMQKVAGKGNRNSSVFPVTMSWIFLISSFVLILGVLEHPLFLLHPIRKTAFPSPLSSSSGKGKRSQRPWSRLQENICFYLLCFWNPLCVSKRMLPTQSLPAGK